MIFRPDPVLTDDPSSAGLPFEEAWIEAEDGVRLHAWLIPGPRDALMVWFHGNAGNISHRVERAAMLHRRLGMTLLLFDYRGYGRSEGRPTERGLYRDGEAVLRWAASRPDLAGLPLVLYGRSLGSAVAIELASRHQVAAVVVESAFRSIQAVAARTLQGRLFAWLFRTRFASEKKIGRVGAPVLLVHGDRDEDVPFDHGLRLFRLASPPKEMLAVAGAGHGDLPTVGGEAYYQGLERFLSRHLPHRSAAGVAAGEAAGAGSRPPREPAGGGR